MASPNLLPVSETMAADLARVEDALRDAVHADDTFLTELASHLILAGGKRIRPGFALASSFALDLQERPAEPEAVMGAVSVELVHLGSLYHDDVMDDALTRRTVESVNARWGNLKAILAGDFLLAKASEIAADLGTEVARLLASTIAALCEGQIRELQDAYNPDRTEEDYFRSIAGKTAALLATSCRIGAIIAAVPRPLVETLTTFGHCYGMAFQVVDDILDVVSSEAHLGKPAGNDLVEGNYTLPVLRALAEPGSAPLRELLGRPLVPDERERAREMVQVGAGVPSSLAVAQQFADQAAAALEPLEGTVAARQLARATDHLITEVAAAASR